MSFYDASVRHAIYIERYKKRVARQVVERLDVLGGQVFAEVAASDLEQLTRRNLDRLLAKLNRIINEAYDPITGDMSASVRDFALYEAEWQAASLERLGGLSDLGVASDADLWSAVNSRPFQGKLLKDWLKDLAPNTAARVRQTVRQGYTDGLGAVEVARQIRGTRAQRGVMDISKRGAETMVRTALAHTASRARDLEFARSERIRSIQWVSVLDHRTSTICQNNDGRVGPAKKGSGWKAPAGFKVLKPRMARPPAHPGCRSAIIPLTDGNTQALRVRPTYQDWLKQQPASVQDDILGPTRGALYRDGGYTVDRFSDQGGKEYTLDELRRKDRETFDDLFGD